MLAIPWHAHGEYPAEKFRALAEPVGDGNVEFVVGPVSLADILEVQGDVGWYVTSLIEGGMDLGEPYVWFVDEFVKNGLVYIGVRVDTSYYGRELSDDGSEIGG